ncbi:ETS-related transcription factor Elf-3 isoform X1 [Vicugna pacos]|uniref:ETS-related transcription factor Elf-3 isoform X1 n=1 Tax=Vicugna pacos TaxID=30538 RepID=A0ABM5C8F7_VICPA
MAATCEISNVFSNYFSTMYSSEDPTLASVPPAAALGADDLALALSSPQMPLEGAEKASWSGEQPQLWSKAQVLDWVSYQVEKHKYDASTIDLSRCDMDGAALCRCAPEELRLVFGPLGDQLYSQLWDLTSSFPDELGWIMELLEKDSMTLQEPLGDQGPFEQGSPFAQEMLEDYRQASPFYPGSVGAGAPSPGSSEVSTTGTGTSQSSHASDSGGSDVDLDAPDTKLFSGDGLPDCKKGDLKHGKRKRGRPRKLSKESRECMESKKNKHGERGASPTGPARRPRASGRSHHSLRPVPAAASCACALVAPLLLGWGCSSWKLHPGPQPGPALWSVACALPTLLLGLLPTTASDRGPLRAVRCFSPSRPSQVFAPHLSALSLCAV